MEKENNELNNDIIKEKFDMIQDLRKKEMI